ncbi:hypothetical protein J2T55_000996 [Methylohalomonas lacus]|uniref:Uncharacterized protein n=2 Tax=Methylohalomonas lacus TaxID=398773 RepID=A0AAE3HKP0_9GAMM|nr:hypothetical protein [Methylohalomonas lacus]
MALSFALLSATSPVAAEQLADRPAPAGVHYAYAGFSVTTTGNISGHTPLNDDQLGQVRGLFTEPMLIQASNGNETGVILWDETSSSGNRTSVMQSNGHNNSQNNRLKMGQ